LSNWADTLNGLEADCQTSTPERSLKIEAPAKAATEAGAKPEKMICGDRNEHYSKGRFAATYSLDANLVVIAFAAAERVFA
jgi:hypothetical protein